MGKQEDQNLLCRGLVTDFHQRYNQGQPTDVCPPQFDGDICWPQTAVNSTAAVPCPFNQFCDECTLPKSETLVYKECFANGTWLPTNYNKCVYIFMNAVEVKCAAVNCYLCHDITATVSDISIYLASASLVLLLFCLIVFNAYSRLQCMRITIRKHLCSAFAVRFVALILLTVIKATSKLFSKHENCYPHVYEREIVCKTILFVQLYGLNASIWWMFVEGIYLSSRLSTFGMHSEGSIMLYSFIGWGTPCIWTLAWALLMEFHNAQKKFCWMPYTQSSYKWIIAVPMLTALVANFVILLIVVGILVQKLWADNVHEDRKLSKTIKATLMLVPLLGVPNLLVFYQPDKGSPILPYYMISCALLQNSQGIFIGLAYCVFNKEVRSCFRRSYLSLCGGCFGHAGSSSMKSFWSLPKTWNSADSDHRSKGSPLMAPNYPVHGQLDNDAHELTRLNADLDEHER